MNSLMEKRLFWYLFNTCTSICWIFVIAGFFSAYSGVIKGAWMFLVIIFGVIHPLEIMISLPLSSKKGFAPGKTIIATIFWGLGWWIPVKREIFTS